MRNAQREESMRLKGKIALITGGNSGIGLATARRFTTEGATVVITGRNQDTLDAAENQLGAQALVLRSDVLDGKDRQGLFAAIKDKFGRLDIVFANAGTVKLGSIADMSEATFDEVLKTNVTAVFLTIQAALPLLQPGASIVVNGSIAASSGFFPGAGAYAASKAAVRGMAQSMAAELSQRGIRINTLAPGLVRTPLWGDHLIPPEVAAARSKNMQARVPLDRWGEADEIASAVLFLASDDSSYVNGSELFVDGGVTGATFGAPIYRG
jgi:NAD(P)-dependent dehydrogenase (short-subunit alcohol dehydrogenase family)